MAEISEVLPYRSPRGRDETTAHIGMVIFLASWAMMFASLFFAYAFLRSRMPTWPPARMPALPWKLPLANTALLAASSAVLQYGVRSVGRGAVRRLGPSLLVTLVLGSLFVLLQVLLWRTLASAGLQPETGGPYSAVFYGLTWFHALHVVVGLVGLGLLCRRAFAGEFSPARYLPVRLWAQYWHFVGVVWALMFVAIFLL